MNLRPAFVVLTFALTTLLFAGCGTFNLQGSGNGSGAVHGNAGLSIPLGK